MLDGVTYLKPILRWRIGNGKGINILDDVWIGDRAISTWPTFVHVNITDIYAVDTLLNDKGYFNSNLLHEYFGEELINIIKQMKFLLDHAEDSMVLIHQHSGRSIAALNLKKLLKNMNPLTLVG
ncbi:hypothetical protein M5K25_026576 [Dendrobium thyrsiflorum]|uniref:Uncharacterized protein n=1 Tax=Dendrobium thyrsiflorum TaxID=117978 RepID=A0ABD0TXK5_DENTH